MHSERFQSLLTSEGPFGSVYFDDSHDTENAAALIDLRWREVHAQLDQQGAAAELTRHLERAIVDEYPRVGRGGRAVIAGSAGVLIDESLIRPPAVPVVRVSPLPYIVPVVEHGMEQGSYVVVEVDHAGGDIAIHTDDVMRTETVDGGGYPVHKAALPEMSGYGDPQPRSDEARRKNVRAVADRLTEVADEFTPELVFVVGEVRSRADLVAALPERVAARAVQLQVGARRSGIAAGDLEHAIDQEFARRRIAAVDDAVRRFEAGRAHGLATEGLEGVCAALRAGAVETLIIGDLGHAVVLAGDDLSTVAPNPEVLSELGTAPTQTLRADEALPMAAIATDATLVRADERISPADGIAAVLRYPLSR